VTISFSGGCACGSIGYVCSRAPVATLNCHCLDCQRSSGAPFASGFIVRVSDVTITGTPKTRDNCERGNVLPSQALN